MAINAGELRYVMCIFLPVDDPADPGDPTPEPVVTLNVGITPLAGREPWIAMQLAPDVTHKIQARYVCGLTPQHYGICEGRVYQFTQVIDVDERHRELLIMARERV